jgi:hypothetical protein
MLNSSILLFLISCTTIGPDTGVTQLTTQCDNEVRRLLDCRKDYEQFARTFRFDIGIIEQTAVGFGVGAQQLMQLDSLTADLLAHKRQVCTDYNNCILSKEEYKKETSFLRRAQLKVREVASQFTSGSPPGVGQSVSAGGEPPKASPAFEELFSEVVQTLVRREDSEYSVDSDVSSAVDMSTNENTPAVPVDTKEETDIVQPQDDIDELPPGPEINLD